MNLCARGQPRKGDADRAHPRPVGIWSAPRTGHTFPPRLQAGLWFPLHFKRIQMTERDLTHSQSEILLGLPERYPVDRIDRIWIFPPRTVRSVEMGLFVLSLIADETHFDQRILITLRYQVDRSERSPRRNEKLEEEGIAPSARIELVIAGVLKRAGAEDGDPAVLDVGMNPDRWPLVLAEHGLAVDSIYE